MVLGNWVRRIRLSAAHCMAGVLFFTQAALAQSTDSEFEARVREYLLSNPEVIVEALHILSERERKDGQPKSASGNETIANLITGI